MINEKQEQKNQTLEKTGGKQDTRFKKGQSGNPAGRPKGSRNFEVIFREAAMAVAKDLQLGKKPDAVQIELVKRGIKEGLQGKYPFFKDLMDRLHGQPKQQIEHEGGEIKIKHEFVFGDGKKEK